MDQKTRLRVTVYAADAAGPGQYRMILPAAAVSERSTLLDVTVVHPSDTDTTTYDFSVVRDGDTFRETWTPRGKNADELIADAEVANDASIRSEAKQALAGNRQYLQLLSPTTAQMRAQLERLTRQNNGLIRLVLGELDGVD